MIRTIKPKTDDFMDGPIKREKRKIYPHFRIDNSHLPEAKKWDIGKEYTVTLKLKMTGISISRFQNESEFDIIGIDPNSKESK